MSTPHNEANKGDYAKTVIMPGDPLRAKYIVENFFDDYKLINQVRGMYAYTGHYKEKTLSVMAHGMGMPSVGIYTYELYKFYDVENIIRIGSCGAYSPDLDLFDIVLSDKVYTESNYALTFNNDDCHFSQSSNKLNSVIEETSKEDKIKVLKGNTICTDMVDFYMPNPNKFLERIPKDFNPLSGEMEAFALFYNANFFNKNASCLMSVVDSQFKNEIVTHEQRQNGLTNMIKLALDSAIKL